MLNVAENRDVEIGDSAFAVANRQGVEQSLRRMFVRPIPSVDHGNIQMPGHKVRSARSRMPYDQTIGLHGIQCVHGVQERFAFFQAGGFGL